MWCLYSTLFSVFFRWPLRSRSGVRHGRRSAELVRHPVVGADRSSACDAAGPLHVLVQPLLCLHLPVRDCSHRQDDPHPHPCQEPLLRGESCFFILFFCLPSFGNNFQSADMCAHAEFYFELSSPGKWNCFLIVFKKDVDCASPRLLWTFTAMGNRWE